MLFLLVHELPEDEKMALHLRLKYVNMAEEVKQMLHSDHSRLSHYLNVVFDNHLSGFLISFLPYFLKITFHLHFSFVLHFCLVDVQLKTSTEQSCPHPQ